MADVYPTIMSRLCLSLAAVWLSLCFVIEVSAGTASWYGEKHRGLTMANGQPFDPDQLTAASWIYPLGTRVRVAHGDRSVMVTVTDRGPSKRLVNEGREIDLSHAAFAVLADPDLGLIEVSVAAVEAGRDHESRKESEAVTKAPAKSLNGGTVARRD